VLYSKPTVPLKGIHNSSTNSTLFHSYDSLGNGGTGRLKVLFIDAGQAEESNIL